MQRQNWAVVLAAGSGTRLQGMTTRGNGTSVPKQYCSLQGGASLLRHALARACTVVPQDRVLCVVAEQHEQWWRRELNGLPAGNVIVQPLNRGTAVGTLLPLLVARCRDPAARLIFLPADHYIADEGVFARGMTSMFQAFETFERRVFLLGLEPDEPDTELGYIVPAAIGRARVQPVRKFVEKPTLRCATSLVREGALWNSFVFATEADALLALFRECMPEVLAAFAALPANPVSDAARLAGVYRNLANVDLSRDVFAGNEDRLAALRVPACGWTDLGTPRRVVRCLTGSTSLADSANELHSWRPSHVNLVSACHATLRVVGG